jgi:hypothetical protein
MELPAVENRESVWKTVAARLLLAAAAARRSRPAVGYLAAAMGMVATER